MASFPSMKGEAALRLAALSLSISALIHLSACGDSPKVAGPGSTAEVCDGKDNDGDGQIDEVVKDLCEKCNSSCGVVGNPGSGPSSWNLTGSEDVQVDETGALILRQDELQSKALWVANTNEGTVSKLDSLTGRELARYPSVCASRPAGVRPWNHGGACRGQSATFPNGTGNCPSRTAVDQNFDGYVANRAFGGQGSVTKFAFDVADCRGSNTSRDVNNDGVIDVNNPQEFVGEQDDCCLWTAAVGNPDPAFVPGVPQTQLGIPRALAVAPAVSDRASGDIYVGLWGEQQVCAISPDNGTTLFCVNSPGFRSYGAYGFNERMYFANRNGTEGDAGRILGYVVAGATNPTFQFVEPAPVVSCQNPNNPAVTSISVPYGITVDRNGVVYLADGVCTSRVLRYDPAAAAGSRWSTIEVPGFNNQPGKSGTRGVAVDPARNWLYVAVSHRDNFYRSTLNTTPGNTDTELLDNRVEIFDLASRTHLRSCAIPNCLVPIGVGAGFDGELWAVCQQTNNAARLNPEDCSSQMHPVGTTPYTYSDFLGRSVNLTHAQQGVYPFQALGPSNKCRWLGVDIQGDVPPGTTIRVDAKVANTPAEASGVAFVEGFQGQRPVNLTIPPGPLPQGRYFEGRLVIRTSNSRRTPRLTAPPTVIADCN